jgi:hypothetical protein
LEVGKTRGEEGFFFVKKKQKTFFNLGHGWSQGWGPDGWRFLGSFLRTGTVRSAWFCLSFSCRHATFAVLLVKTKQEDFLIWGMGGFTGTVQVKKSFLLLFFKKEVLALPVVFMLSGNFRWVACEV